MQGGSAAAAEQQIVAFVPPLPSLGVVESPPMQAVPAAAVEQQIVAAAAAEQQIVAFVPTPSSSRGMARRGLWGLYSSMVLSEGERRCKSPTRGARELGVLLRSTSDISIVSRVDSEGAENESVHTASPDSAKFRSPGSDENLRVEAPEVIQARRRAERAKRNAAEALQRRAAAAREQARVEQARAAAAANAKVAEAGPEPSEQAKDIESTPPRRRVLSKRTSPSYPALAPVPEAETPKVGVRSGTAKRRWAKLDCAHSPSLVSTPQDLKRKFSLADATGNPGIIDAIVEAGIVSSSSVSAKAARIA